MSKFILGIIATLLVLGLGGLAVATLGLMPTNADATPPRLERRVAAGALDASMERHAPRASSPIPPTDENLIDGMKLYYELFHVSRHTRQPAESAGEVVLSARATADPGSAG